MLADPARLNSVGKFNQEFILEMASTGANALRIPAHPQNWVADEDYLWRYRDPIVSWAGKAGMYVIIDWHYIGNVAIGAGSQMPDLDAVPYDLTLEIMAAGGISFQEYQAVLGEVE